MRVARTPTEVREALAPARREGRSIGLVPTMGYLHEGHLSLLRAARAECDIVVISLFVNPAQFGPGEDLEHYPRDEPRDLRLAAEAGTDLVYAPATGQVYPDGFATSVTVRGLSEVLCGDPARRGPDHFRGVATVVAKLLNTVDPAVAYFGQKDAQQAVVIRRMVRDLDFPVRIEVLPTIREGDGLALSSRNAYLGPEERRQATALSRALKAAEQATAAGARSTDDALAVAREVLAEAGIEPEYLEARDGESLVPVASFNGRPVLVAIAATIGGARLIDNVVLDGGPSPRPVTPPSRSGRKGGRMQRQMLKSKIHRATVTGCDPDYVGSVTIDTELLNQADILANEQVHVWDITNGARIVSYAIEGEPGSGEIRINGAAALLVNEGDKVIIASYAAYDQADLDTYSPVVVHVDHANRAARIDSSPEILLAPAPSDDELPGALGAAIGPPGGSSVDRSLDR